MPDNIRPIAIGLIAHNDKLFVFEGHDPYKPEIFYRPLGGSIEFGERGEQALSREFKEEIGAELKNTTYLTTMENIFTYKGKPHHEIALVYNCEFKDESFYAKSEIIGREDDGSPLKCLWKPISQFLDDILILYPDGLIDIINSIEVISRRTNN